MLNLCHVCELIDDDFIAQFWLTRCFSLCESWLLSLLIQLNFDAGPSCFCDINISHFSFFFLFVDLSFSTLLIHPSQAKKNLVVLFYFIDMAVRNKSFDCS